MKRDKDKRGAKSTSRYLCELCPTIMNTKCEVKPHYQTGQMRVKNTQWLPKDGELYYCPVEDCNYPKTKSRDDFKIHLRTNVAHDWRARIAIGRAVWLEDWMSYSDFREMIDWLVEKEILVEEGNKIRASRVNLYYGKA